MHGTIKKHVLLQNDANLTPQQRCIYQAYIHAIYQDLTAVRSIKPLQQLGERRFPRTRWTDNAYNLACGNIEANVSKHIWRVGPITKRNVGQLDLAMGGLHLEAGLLGALRRTVQDIAEPLHRNLDLLKVLPYLRQPDYRRRSLVHDHAKRHQPTHRQLGIHDSFCAEEQNRGRGELVDVLNGVLTQIAEHRCLERRLHVGGEPLLPFIADDGFDRRRLEGLNAKDKLDQHLLAGSAAVKSLIDLLAQRRTDRERNKQIERNERQNDCGQLDRIGKQDADKDDRKNQVDRRGRILDRSRNCGSSRSREPARLSAPSRAFRNS